MVGGRIRHEQRGGAWCPQQHISKDSGEFLQIDLGRLKVVTLVETQGRFGHGQVNPAPTDSYIWRYIAAIQLTCWD